MHRIENEILIFHPESAIAETMLMNWIGALKENDPPHLSIDTTNKGIKIEFISTRKKMLKTLNYFRILSEADTETLEAYIEEESKSRYYKGHLIYGTEVPENSNEPPTKLTLTPLKV